MIIIYFSSNVNLEKKAAFIRSASIFLDKERHKLIVLGLSNLKLAFQIIRGFRSYLPHLEYRDCKEIEGYIISISFVPNLVK